MNIGVRVLCPVCREVMVVKHINYHTRILAKIAAQPCNALSNNRMLICICIDGSMHRNTISGFFGKPQNIAAFNMIGNKITKHGFGLISGKEKVC